MNLQERHTVTGLVILMLVLWVGFILHRSPSFPGSFTGSMIGIIATFFMFVPLLYLIVKRLKKIKTHFTKWMKMSTFLRWHIYAGIIGPILGLIHTGHRFDSLVGISLILLMLLVVISGFIGRYLLGQITTEMRDKKQLWTKLLEQYENLSIKVSSNFLNTHGTITYLPFFFKKLSLAMAGAPSDEITLLKLADSISDVEYSIKMHETIKLWFKRWLKFHIVISLVLYGILVFHIFSEFYFGLRWL
ncbi:MAG: hypothetical protein CME70_11095 [Halobacteriovorax sp.]|nr:hypothetical protein [Halobacteriovorax sp.]|tara:strand:- start:11998 stop:12735 length:738 start_codon:yes stop_codon:yes gene_type:complete